MILGYPDKRISEWINVYTVIKESEGKYFNYGYNISEKRWRLNIVPDNSTQIADFINNTIMK